jgi:S-DNA-T family DNA segregation ATPase FtsK/SpoIIIE
VDTGGRTVRKTAARSAGASGAPRPRAVTSSANPQKTGTSRSAPAKRPARETHSRPERLREIVGLVFFAIAVFLIFCLVATEKAGVVGRGIETGLVWAFGRLAFVAPIALIAVGVTTVFEYRLRKSYRFLGVMVFLVGLFLLMGGATPPFGSHSAELFVRSAFEGRAGALGEALYGGVHALLGIVGVGVIAWVLELAGFGLATGITARWLGGHTRSAAQVVKTTVDRTTIRRRETNHDFDFDVADWPTRTAGAERSGSSKPVIGNGGGAGSGGQGTHLGPIDLVARLTGHHAEAAATSAEAGVFGDAFDDWTSGQTAQHSPLAPCDPDADTLRRGRPVLDGAHAFADLFIDDKPAQASTGGAAFAGLGDEVSASERTASDLGSSAGAIHDSGSAKSTLTTTEAVEGQSAVSLEEESSTGIGGEQEALPGLARETRQMELPVSEPTYLLPEPDMLRKSNPRGSGADAGGQRDTSAVLIQALGQFGVQARVIGMVVGPRVTRYELHLAPGTKVSKVTALKDDLAYALATTEIRILAPIPGKSAVGVEIPNSRPDFVTLGDIYHEFPKSAGPLMVWLGKDISGKAVYADLTRLPHLLIAGTTGSGKSGCVNCLVSSVLLRSTPEQVRMIMIDPKKVELSHYDRIPHLLVPVVTNMKDAAGVLHNVVKEMEDRYELMELEHTRSLAEMNKVRARRGERPMPYIVIVIDELADLMMASPQEVEDYVIRIAQKARAVGIHLIVATQRPSADVITGMIKANIPSRIAFAVSSQTDSRVILDVNGAETLLGQGDMLFKPLGSSHLQRVQGAYITEEEIAILVNHWRHQAEPEFREELLRRPPDPKKGDKSDDDLFDPDADDLLADAAQLVIETGSASVSMLQRRLRVGYTRAGRLIDMLERRGIVGPWEGSKPRQILVEPDDYERVLAVLKAGERDGDEEDYD